MVRNWLKVFHRQRERLERCPVNVDLVDASGIYRSNGIADAMLANAFGKHLSHFREQQLGIAQTANSVRRISALQRRCALIEEFCFFIVLSVEFGRIPGSNPLPVQMCVHRGKTFVAKSPRVRQDLSYIFLKNSSAMRNASRSVQKI